ncbi:hypothetical protein [Burkholderia phage BCSR129]|nr:hypothetical protein [Burkholderia phage BCSR129]
MKRALSIAAALINKLAKEREELMEMKKDLQVMRDDDPMYIVVTSGPNPQSLSITIPDDSVIGARVEADLSKVGMYDKASAKLIAMQIKDSDGREATAMSAALAVDIRLRVIDDAIARAQGIASSL